MFGKSIQFNRRNAMSFLLAVFMLTLAVTPALARVDEGDDNGQAVRHCRVISHGQEALTVYCYQVMPHQARPAAEKLVCVLSDTGAFCQVMPLQARPVAEKPLVRPSIVKAELFNRVTTEPLVQAISDQ